MPSILLPRLNNNSGFNQPRNFSAHRTVTFLVFFVLASIIKLALHHRKSHAYSLLPIVEIIHYPGHDYEHYRASHCEWVTFREPRRFCGWESQYQSPSCGWLTNSVHDNQCESTLFWRVAEDVLCPAVAGQYIYFFVDLKTQSNLKSRPHDQLRWISGRRCLRLARESATSVSGWKPLSRNVSRLQCSWICLGKETEPMCHRSHAVKNGRWGWEFESHMQISPFGPSPGTSVIVSPRPSLQPQHRTDNSDVTRSENESKIALTRIESRR